MAFVVRSDVLDLSHAGFEAFATGFLHAGFVGDVFVCEDRLDVGPEDDGAAGEVAESQDCLDLVLGW